MNTLIIVAGLGLVVVLAITLYLRSGPEGFVVERSGHVAAPPGVVFALVDNFHNWIEWSPYERRDPNLKRTYDGPASGPGAVYAWEGNKNIGSGRMTMLDATEPELINIRLEFFRPFKAINAARFSFTPVDGGTHVTWRMEGKNTCIGKAISVVIDMDKMIAKDFEDGIANIDTLVRTSPPLSSGFPGMPEREIAERQQEV